MDRLHVENQDLKTEMADPKAQLGNNSRPIFHAILCFHQLGGFVFCPADIKGIPYANRSLEAEVRLVDI
jgi:hypothetical protein